MPDYDQNLENLSIAISPPLAEDLLHVARQSGRSVSHLTEKALVPYLKDERGTDYRCQK
jgi:hypothetical protein